MPRLNSANNAETNLATAVGATDTSISIVDATPFPEAPFRITIDAEIIEVGSVDLTGNRFTMLTRGVEGTSSASHNAGTTVQNRFTAGTYSELVSENELDAINAHLNNTENPHQVTAAQIGAITASTPDFTRDIDILADNPSVYFHGTDEANPSVIRWNRTLGDNGLEFFTANTRNFILRSNGETEFDNNIFVKYSDLSAQLQANDLIFDNPYSKSYIRQSGINSSLSFTVNGSESFLIEESVVNSQKRLQINDNAEALSLSGTDHVYLEFHKVGYDNRYGYLGYASPNNDLLYINNGKDRIRLDTVDGIEVLDRGNVAFIAERSYFQLSPHNTSDSYALLNSSGIGNGGLSEITFIPDRHHYGFIGTSDRAWYRSYAASHVNTSSIEGKVNVKELNNEDAYQLIKDMKPMIYQEKKDEKLINTTKIKEKVGLIAEEAPSQITDEEGKGIDLYQYSTVILSAVKVLQSKIEDIERRV